MGELYEDSDRFRRYQNTSAAQLVNEYGWIWLWRNGEPAKLTENTFAYYLGEDASPAERRELQAYWVQAQTEWLRAERSFAGVLSFCYLTNNYGFTGDWFLDPIAELKTGPTLHWSKHCFAPTAVFIDLLDERYTKHLPPRETGAWMTFNLVGVNDLDTTSSGEVAIRLLDSAGQTAGQRTTRISIPPYGKQHAPVAIQLPDTPGGYLLLAEFTPEIEQDPKTTISRRYLKVGSATDYEFHDYPIDPLED